MQAGTDRPLPPPMHAVLRDTCSGSATNGKKLAPLSSSRLHQPSLTPPHPKAGRSPSRSSFLRSYHQRVLASAVTPPRNRLIVDKNPHSFASTSLWKLPAIECGPGPNQHSHSALLDYATKEGAPTKRGLFRAFFQTIHFPQLAYPSLSSYFQSIDLSEFVRGRSLLGSLCDGRGSGMSEGRLGWLGPQGA